MIKHHYSDLECIIETTDRFKNNSEKSYTTEVSEHIPSGFSKSIISSFRSIEINMMNTKVKST